MSDSGRKRISRAVFRFLLNGCSVFAAALVGNWVGGQMRYLLTGQRVHSVRASYTNEQGTTIYNVPVVTKFYPAVAASWLGRPRWLYAFLGGVFAGGLVDDRYEHLLLERILAHIPQGKGQDRETA